MFPNTRAKKGKKRPFKGKLQAIGRSDFVRFFILTNKYKTRLIQNQVIEKCVTVWDKAGRERLTDCFESWPMNIMAKSPNYAESQ